jgi:intein-encoded DNA endonuclease-like protein
MSNESATIVQRLWNYCNVLRDDGVSYGDYVEQLENLPDPDVLAQEIVESLQSALTQFENIAEELGEE